ncbi:M23 family metallopeptidase [Enterococcus sp. LJL98]
MKTLILLASTGFLFLLPLTDVQGTETTQQLAAQEGKITDLQAKVTTLEAQQARLQIQLDTVPIDQEGITQTLETYAQEKTELRHELEREESRLRVMATIQSYLKDSTSNGVETASQKAQEKKLEALQAKMTQLETQIQTFQAEVTEQKEQREAELAEKEQLAEETKTITEKIEKETQKLTELKEKATAEAEEAQRLAETGFLSPLNGPLNMSSPFGYRADPTGYSGNGHDGVDFTGNYGDTILAARYGTVVETGFDWSAGNYVILQHDNGYYSYYMHMTAVSVSEGQSVETSEQIGTMGTTGNSTGVHLHFGLATGIWSGFVDPVRFIM